MPRMRSLYKFLVALSLNVNVVPVHSWNPKPPCAAPFPNSAVPETWCSNIITSDTNSGVVVAEYGLPVNSTLVTGKNTDEEKTSTVVSHTHR